jgi:DNA replication protein DnaC
MNNQQSKQSKTKQNQTKPNNMNTTQNLEQLSQLKLHGMADSYQAAMQLPVNKQPESHELVANMLQAEIQSRQHQRTTTLLRLARLRYPARLEQINCSPARNLTKQQLHLLSDCSYIQRAENILITGATGCGKSYLACAFGHQACLMGYKTLYLNMNRFCEKLALSRLDGTYLKLLGYLEKAKLLIIDDLGLQQLDHPVKLALLQILEDRYQNKSVIVASQLPIGTWHEHLGEPTLADAIMDRLTAQAHRLELKGESLRKKTNQKSV